MRSGEAFQTMKDMGKVVLDKTGTITIGKPKVEHIVPEGDQNKDALLQVVASAESRSEHPLAKAIVQEAKEAGLSLTEITDFKAWPGFGIEAYLDEKKVLVGNTRFMIEHGVNLAAVEEKVEEVEIGSAKRGGQRVHRGSQENGAHSIDDHGGQSTCCSFSGFAGGHRRGLSSSAS
jgi:Cu+-exporting ATPase